MHLDIGFPLLPVLLLLQVRQSSSVQDLQASHEVIVKINAAGEIMNCSAAMDVLILMDGSYSIGKGSFGFERSRHYAIKLSQAMDVAPDKVRIGLLQFGTAPRLEISLDECSTKEQLIKRLGKIPYRGGSTQTGLAFKYVLRKGFPGGRNASSVARVIVLLSDGKSQGSVGHAAAQLKENGVVVFAVGLRYPRWEELHALASPPIESHVFFAEHFADAVNGLCTSLSASAVCNATTPGCHAASYPCERRTLETVRELQGNFMCWKGSKGAPAYTSLCPHYRYKKAYKRHKTICHRTICADPCDSEPCLNGGTCVSEGPEAYRCMCLPGYGGDPHCAPALSLDCSVDLFFLVEGSDTLGLEGFHRLKAFLKRFLQTVMGPNTHTKVGLAVYGGETRIEARVGRYAGDARGLLKAVDGLQLVGGEALTGKALVYMTTYAFLNVSDDLPHVVVLVKQSPSADEVLESARYMRDREVFIIAVGPDTLKGQLDNITENRQRTITYPSSLKLNGKIPELKAKICSVDSLGCLGQAVDLVFVVDASDGVGRENFVTMRDFVRSLTVQFDVNRDVAQVALVTYGRRPQTAFALDAHDSGSAVLTAINGAGYVGGVPASIGAALLHVHSDVLTVAAGARPGVNQLVVVVTDGSGGQDAWAPAQRMRDDSVVLFVVAVGDVQRDTVLRIAGNEQHLTFVQSFEDLKYIEDVLVQMMCADVKRQVDLCKPNPCMNNGICRVSVRAGSFRCQCHGYEGPHCEIKSRRSRGDQPRPPPAGPRRPSRQKKSHQELLLHYKQHRKRHAAHRA